jgi:hypothetical protein
LRPVDGGVAADGHGQLLGDLAQSLVAKHGHGAVVGAERVVEGKLVLGEPELLAAPTQATRGQRVVLFEQETELGDVTL